MAERLAAVLDEARWVRYHPDGIVYAWFGGHGVHVYLLDGREVDLFNVGDFRETHATLDEVQEAIGERFCAE